MAENQDAQAGKARKRQPAKASVRVATKKLKSTIHLTPEASQRLDIHVAMMGPGFDRSSLIENLINTHLRRYVVSDRGGAASDTDELAAAG
ncbi:hypothetical protein TA3x_005799 (plasmid) [Tundrisphaera sp. TA3]|uniref:hypothetical protein n=1 Tax=Tundrisphaera sp. TA3 TaxID=3435775 RepID=UPI003EBF8810